MRAFVCHAVLWGNAFECAPLCRARAVFGPPGVGRVTKWRNSHCSQGEDEGFAIKVGGRQLHVVLPAAALHLYPNMHEESRTDAPVACQGGGPYYLLKVGQRTLIQLKSIVQSSWQRFGTACRLFGNAGMMMVMICGRSF